LASSAKVIKGITAILLKNLRAKPRLRRRQRERASAGDTQ
jgi:hypothetical protein